MRNVILAILGLSAGLIACEAREDRVKVKPAGKLPKVVHDVDHIPTNPEGGSLPDKRPQLSPEENARRQAANSVAPIVWGESFAGISFATTQPESEAILANGSIYEEDGRYIYPEGVHILWNKDQPAKPATVYIFDSYNGTASLPEPYKKLQMEMSYAEWLVETEDRIAMIKALGRAFAKEAADYDCLKLFDCEISVADDGFTFVFPNGSISFDKAGKLNFILMSATSKRRPSLEPFVYGESVSGITLNHSRADIEKIFGAPEYEEEAYAIYNRSGLAAMWEEDGSVRALIVLPASKATFEGPEGTIAMGSSLAALAPVSDKGEQLAVVLDRHLSERTSSYNCLEALPKPTCAVEIDGTEIAIYLEKASFFVSYDEKRTLKQIQIAK